MPWQQYQRFPIPPWRRAEGRYTCPAQMMFPYMAARMFGVSALGHDECSLVMALAWESCLANMNSGVTPLQTPAWMENQAQYIHECRIKVNTTKDRTKTPGYASSTLSSPIPNSNWIACHKHQLVCLYFIVFSPNTTTNLALHLKEEQTTAIHWITSF